MENWGIEKYDHIIYLEVIHINLGLFVIHSQ